LLDQIGEPIEHFYGDAAYDQWKVYELHGYEATLPSIPASKTESQPTK